MLLRWSLGAALTAFAVTLGLMVGQHLSSDALVLLLGIAIGCGVSWPGYYWLFRLANRSASAPSPVQMLYPPVRPEPPLPKPLPAPRKFLFLEEETNEYRSVLILK